MSNDQKPSDPGPQQQNIRQDLVNTAVNFLLNPGVINKPYAHKTAFLKKKGLTEAEISSAYEKAEKDPKYNEIVKSNNTLNNLPVLPPAVPVYRKSISFWSQISRFSSSLIVLGVALFGAHYIYKNYIEPLIFGEDSERKKSQKLEAQLLEMTNSLSQLEKHVSSLEESIKCQSGQMDKFLQNEVSEYYPTPLALKELKTEIASVKSLLLNRHQFPALPKVTPTIPRWQLPSNENDTIKQNGEASEHQESEEHGGSVTKPTNECNLEDDTDTSKQNNETDAVIKNPDVKSVQHEHSEEFADSLSS